MIDWKFLMNRYLLRRRITSDGYVWDFSLTDCVETNEDFLDPIILYSRNTMIDVGANAGAWCIRANKYYDHIVAFEPNRDTYNHLTDNVQRNHCGNIQCLRYALSSRDTGTGYFKINPTRDSNIGFTEACASTTSLDSFNFKSVSLIKIDVEGSGYDVVKGSLDTIKRYSPIIILEVHTELESKVPEILPNYSWERYYRDSLLDNWIWRENNKQLFLVGRSK